MAACAVGEAFNRGRWLRRELVLLILLAGACLAGWLAVPPPPAQAALPPSVGFNSRAFNHLGNGSSTFSEVEREIGLIREAGGEVVRLNISWSWLEVADDRYNSPHLPTLDFVFGAARRNGLGVLAVLTSTPCWASTGPRNLITHECQSGFFRYPPRDPNEFGEFAAWLANRYGSQLVGIEAWNEPNAPSGSNFKGTPDDYVALVRAANRSVTGIPILAGSLHAANELDYLRRLYPAIRGNYDIWSEHAYAGRPDGVVDRVKNARQVRLNQGDSAPVWVTEFGWTTCVWMLGRCTFTNSRLAQEEQAEFLPATFLSLGGLPYVGGAIAFELRDAGTSGDPEHNFGIVKRNFTPKLAFDSVSRSLAQ